MQAHHQDLQALLKSLEVDPGQGLEQGQIQARWAEHGENRLKEAKKRSWALRFLDQFKDVMIMILLAAALISFAVALGEGHGRAFFEPGLIVLIVVLNALLGVIQEGKAEKALEALRQMSAPQARVRRKGQTTMIDAAELVPGDILLLEAGDAIAADARLIESASLRSEESSLTGESVPTEKDAKAQAAADAPIGDRSNMVYSGCSVTYGRATAVVTGTGMNTEMGKIAGMLEQSSQIQTPLQMRLAKMGKTLGLLALAACGVIFVIGLLDGMPLLEIFMVAVSLAVSAIPEGLPAIVTIVLSLGVTRMAQRNAIIRSLPAVETLGSATVICSDKTGTLTQNRMTLTDAWSEGEALPQEIPGTDSPSLKRLLLNAVLCCDGEVRLENGGELHIGDPTETAIVAAALRSGITKEAASAQHPRVGELPFDADRKLMSVVVRDGDSFLVIVKGAYDVLVQRCIDPDVALADQLNDQWARRARRVLAVATKRLDTLPEAMTSEVLETQLDLLGLFAMIDPPRKEAKDAVALCRSAGIKPVMITGDHLITASAIAQDLGIQCDGDDAITGAELAAMDDATLRDRVNRIAVYARVSPEDKLRIVRAWQAQGAVVSMTGDGVNDAPALKAADIGCAMGITGTDVAKGAADMTLTDDNFATIVEAVKEGRGIYDNIRKAVAFLLSTNIGEVLCVFAAMILWRQSPFLSMQLLWINLVTDSLPAIALGLERIDPRIMRQPPKPKDESIFAHGYGLRVLCMGIMVAGLALISFAIGRRISLDTGRSMAFLTLALSQISHAYNMRSTESLFKVGFFGNRTMNWAALASLVLTVLVTELPPIATAFGLIQLPFGQLSIALALAMAPLPLVEMAKAIGHFIKKR